MKCHWCKKEFTGEAYIHSYITKGGNPVKHKGHKECYEQYVNRQERRNSEDNKSGFLKIESKLLEIYTIPTLTGVMLKHINKWYKGGYDYDVIYIAIQLSEKAIIKNIDKPWIYHSAIIQNHIPNAVKEKQEQERRKVRQEEQKKLESDLEEIVIKPREIKETRFKQDFDFESL